jgi:hypothetical protein
VLLGKASGIASLFYKNYPGEKKYKGLFNEIVGRVKLWLKNEKSEEEVMLLLKEYYPVIIVKPERKKKIKTKSVIVSRRWYKDLFVIPAYDYKRKKTCLYFLKE